MTAAPSSDVSSEALTTQQNFVPIDFSALIQQVAQAASNAPSGSSDDVHGVPEAGQIGRPSRRKSSTAVVDEAESVDVAHARPKRTRSKKSTHATQEVGDDAGESEPAQRKRRIRRATTDNGQREDGVRAPARKRRRTTTDSPRKRRGSRSSSAPVFDPDADPGEDLDPTVVTMATLCDDTGQGRVSSKAAQILDNHAAWKRSSRERRERMRAKMESKKYGRNDDDEDTTANNAMSSVAAPLTTENSAGASASETPGPSAPVLDVHDEVDEPAGEGSGFDYSQSLATSRFNVQVRIGPNGETIVDEESLFVDRAEEQDTANYTHVEESDATKFVNSASYGKKFRGTRWSAEETDLFFDALSQFGENYELISYVLPGRDRKACKSKFKIEDKRNPNRITHCLNNRVPYDIQTLSRMTGKDFSGPTPIIRARTPPTLSQDNRETSETSRITVRKQSRTPGLSETGDEIGTSERGDDALGHQQHQDIDPTLSNGVVETAASETNSASGSKQVVPPVSRGKPAARKKGKGKQDDGVEVLGAIDGDWD
ncbi:hypothetical protein BV25DRAFT_1793909 [Artomyces pyxidatus]|uniref:Uncharacterized protein n=1 Tax=Artomyces pyxidatus TaxID=48021 RepID=A0ACB8TIE4_9AGAM|nr:hypothetical protein BV25DRAFT_1793909 [Artomyces pyxidatus]